MTFGKVNEMGQFIREAEPEPDVKKSKGTDETPALPFPSAWPLSPPHHFLCPHCVVLELASLCSEESRLRAREYKPGGVAASALRAAKSPLKYLSMLSSCLR